MFEWLGEVEELMERSVQSIDFAVVSPADAVRLTKRLVSLERRLAALRLQCARRAADGGWTESGHRSARSWLASVTGSTPGQAESSLKAAEQLSSAPEPVADAVRSGRMSESQAEAVLAATTADPDAADELLGLLDSGTDLRTLQRRCRDITAAASADEEMDRQERAHRDRSLRTWTDDQGAFCGRFKLTAAAGAQLRGALDRFHEELFVQARADGRRERPDALDADALVAMAEAVLSGGGSGPASRPTIVVRVDLAALERGRTVSGEECSIDGIGPVPVQVVRSMWSEALLAALLVDDGKRIVDLRLPGRCMPRRMRLAVIARDRCCVVPGCGTDRHLEIHHLHAVEDGGSTELANLALLCRWHHSQVTHGSATLTGCPGRWCYDPAPGEAVGGPFDEGFTDLHPPGPAERFMAGAAAGP